MKSGIAAVVAIAASLAIVPVADARTRITSNGSVVTITVPIDVQLVGHDPVTDSDRRYFDQLVDLTNTFWWGNKLRKLKYDGCLTFELALDINLLPDSPDAAPRLDEAHQIEWWLDDPNVRSTVIDHGTLDPNADAPTAFREPLGGTWGSMNIRDFSHELGHLLGLGDDYTGYPESEPLPGREGTMMDTGSDVDQALADRIGNMIEEAGIELPECEVWVGVITQRGDLSPTPCSWTFEGPARVVVAGDGSLSGRASGVFTDVVGPCIGIEPGGGRASLALSGSRDGQRFVIIAEGLSFNMRVSGQTATGQTTSPTTGGRLVWKLNLTCQTCDKQDGG